MTLKDLAWLGLCFLASMEIISYAITIAQGWMRSQNNTTENTDREKREDDRRNLYYEQLQKQSDRDYVEFVEIVRCKDCKHYWKNNPRDEFPVCLATPSDDAFCSEGERTEDE